MMPDERSWRDFDAVLFDLDGVLTPTAEVHQQAWTTMFDDFLAGRAETTARRRYSEADYLAFVDGRPRYDGVRTFLESRHIELPEGDSGEPAGAGSVCALGNRKNDLFHELLQREGIVPFPGSVQFLDHLDDLGVPSAVVSSSRNACDVLAASGLAARFSVVVEGLVAAEEGIPGKPAPDMFLAAAKALGAAPDRSAVVEDAVSGVAAGRAGGFGLVVGVDRGAGLEALTSSGAHLVVADLAELVPAHGRR